MDVGIVVGRLNEGSQRCGQDGAEGRGDQQGDAGPIGQVKPLPLVALEAERHQDDEEPQKDGNEENLE